MGEERVVCECGRIWEVSRYELQLAHAGLLACECGRILKDRDDDIFWSARLVMSEEDVHCDLIVPARDRRVAANCAV
jgi:hypothetical protein